jgi:hypothetical protein
MRGTLKLIDFCLAHTRGSFVLHMVVFIIVSRHPLPGKRDRRASTDLILVGVDNHNVLARATHQTPKTLSQCFH